jgi:adenine-specific DNA-methyltransferase
MHFIGQKTSIEKNLFGKINTNYYSVLDLFGGSGVISAFFRSLGKKVIYNDILKSFQLINHGLLGSTNIDKIEISSLDNLWNKSNINGPSFVFDNYRDIYFFVSECHWIDNVISNILESNYESNIKGILFFALSQACLRKQPFNSFHGSFLKLRLKKRSSPQSWDVPLEDIFIETIIDVNQYLDTVNSQTQPVPIFDISASLAKPSDFSEENIDLVYLDPPFIAGGKRSRKSGNYFKNYHVLEALAYYNTFSEWIDMSHTLKFPKQDHPIAKEFDNWLKKDSFLKNIEQVISRFQESIIVLSYRDDSVISVNELVTIVQSYKVKINVYKEPHLYKNSDKKKKFHDILIIAQ